MSQPQNDAAIPCMVLTFTEDEIALVKQVLADNEYGDDLKAWILDVMRDPDDEEESRYRGSADRVIHNVRDFVENNPDAVRAAGDLVGGFLRKVSSQMRKGPQE